MLKLRMVDVNTSSNNQIKTVTNNMLRILNQIFSFAINTTRSLFTQIFKIRHIILIDTIRCIILINIIILKQ